MSRRKQAKPQQLARAEPEPARREVAGVAREAAGESGE